MNYYKFHIGDYMVATAHLTPIQDLTYRRLLDLYYRIEKPLPLQLEMILRLIRLPETEIENLKIILSEFFSENEKGFENKRCDFEIKTYKKTEKRNRENGKLGGRPVKSETCKETQWVPSGLPDETQKKPSGNPNETLPLTINHKPLTINQENKENILSPAQNSQADKSKKFVKPTIQEIADYCTEKHYAIDADFFWNFYEARGWKMGNTPIKNWKSCIATWIKRDPELKKQPEVKQEEEQTKYKNGVIFDTDDDYI